MSDFIANAVRTGVALGFAATLIVIVWRLLPYVP